MALATILPQTAPPDTVLPALAALLKQLYADDPRYGLPFCRALDRAVAHAAAGSAYEPATATHYRIQSASRSYLWHHVSLDQCSCDRHTPWCWHRGLLHLLTAYAALLTPACWPRPTLLHVPPAKPYDMDAILRACDELY